MKLMTIELNNCNISSSIILILIKLSLASAAILSVMDNTKLEA